MPEDKPRICCTCRWWDWAAGANNAGQKACTRYPQIVWKNSDDWCGEWTQAPSYKNRNRHQEPDDA